MKLAYIPAQTPLPAPSTGDVWEVWNASKNKIKIKGGKLMTSRNASKRCQLWTLFVMTMTLVLSSAHAATVQLSGSVATGITGLDVGGTTYDVGFIGTHTHTEWASMLDVTSLSAANDVILAIATAFDNAGVTSIRYETLSGGTFDYAVGTLYYGTTGTQLIGVSITPTGSWSNFVGASNAPLNNSYPFAVDLTVSSVPVPAAVWLFGSGMLGLIGVARRKKAA